MATQTTIQNNWENYFTRVNYRTVKCNICNEIFRRVRGPVHLHRSHKITDQEVMLEWHNDNHLIWQHYIKRDLFSAECKFCGKLFKSAYDKWYLDMHLRSVHSKEMAAIREEITRTWVSTHFTFDDNCNAICMLCDYFFKIYDGLHVLKNHLKENHNLNENFVHFMQEMVDHLETTMQCTTEESNVATSFQDGNTQ